MLTQLREVRKEVNAGLQANKLAAEPLSPELRRATAATVAGGVAILGLCIPEIGAVPVLPHALEASSYGADVYAGLYILPIKFPKAGRFAVPIRNFINEMPTKALKFERNTQRKAIRGARAIVALAH